MIALGTGWLALGANGLQAQSASSQNDQERNLRAYIELIRSDLRSGKVAVVTKVMDFSDEEGAKFWPIYRDYENELSKIWDDKLALIRDYADHYEDLSDKNAHDLALAAFDLETRRVELKKKYHAKIEQALSAKTAARFFQVENQLLMLIDLQVASMLPIAE